jgi:tetratricopeptide (TPR) repeat protein
LYERGRAHSAKGDWAAAVRDYDSASRLNPGDATTYGERGVAYYQLEQFENALADFKTALRLDPTNHLYRLNRGMALSKQERWVEALSDYKVVIRDHPQIADAYNELAWLLSTCPEKSIRDGRKAVLIASEGVKLTGGRDWSVLGTLAAAHAEAGEFDQAVKFQEQVIASPNLPSSARHSEQERLVLYKAGKPYHEKAEK